MSNPSAWYSASRPWPDGISPVPSRFPAKLGQLGLAADHWPDLGVKPSTRQAVEAAFDWFPIQTLSGQEWCHLMPSYTLAAQYAREAVGANLVVLRYDLRKDGDCLGWDMGPPQGGHSAIAHELSHPSFQHFAERRLNTHGLFSDFESALAFWKVRQESDVLEQASGWAIVRVSMGGRG